MFSVVDIQSLLLPDDSIPEEAGNPDNWHWWPGAMIPIALIGFVLATRVWNAKPKPKAPAAIKKGKDGDPSTF